MRNAIYFMLAIGFILSSCGQSLILPEGVSYTSNEKMVTINTSGSTYKLTALTDDIIKVAYTDSITHSERVFGPILKDQIELMVKEKQNSLIVSTENVSVEITFAPVTFNYFDNNSGLKLREESGFERKGDTTAFRFYLKDNEAVYGTGSRSIPQNRRGYKFQCYNQANYGYGVGADFLNYSVPAWLSSEKYMILIDNPARAWFDIGKTTTDVLDFSSIGGNMVYYFINGNSLKEVMTHYGQLTGNHPLPPIWALGNLQSRFGYRNQKETEHVVNTMIDRGFPIDAIIIDIYWFGEELQNGFMGNLSWDKNNWPDPDGMIKSFAEKGVKTITVSEPFFTKKSQHFGYLDEKKLLGLDSKGNTLTMPYFYFGDAGLIDIFKSESRDWFWQQYKKEKERGIAGWWGDLGEPEVHPDSMVHVNGLAIELHGVYGHEWIAMLYENYERDYPEERLFKLGRAGYAGSQRYGLIPWSGDVGRNWSGFKAQNDVMLGMGLSGLPYMHSDAGGFAQNERDSILYLRWLQYAVFTPVFRPHGDPNAPAEPIFYHDTIQTLVKNSIELRYAMLPYNYTLAWKTSQNNVPMARPLFFEFENQEISDTVADVYMWGENLLIAPVFDPEIDTRKVFLPTGDWYSFHSNELSKGGQTVEVEVTDKSIPVFVKGGSFLPLADVVKTTDFYTGEKINLNCYLSESNRSFSDLIYFDNGKLKNAFAEGEYEKLLLSCISSNQIVNLTIKKEGEGYEGAPENRKIDLAFIGLKKKPEHVSVNGNSVNFNWSKGILNVPGLVTKENLDIEIKK